MGRRSSACRSSMPTNYRQVESGETGCTLGNGAIVIPSTEFVILVECLACARNVVSEAFGTVFSHTVLEGDGSHKSRTQPSATTTRGFQRLIQHAGQLSRSSVFDMKSNTIDFSVDLAYGILLFLAIVLIVTVGTNVGIAFGLGALVSYVIHVAWKMSRFDPDWMTQEVTEQLGETITEEVTESVGEKVSEDVTEKVSEDVTEKVSEDVTEEVEEKVAEGVSEDIEEKVAEKVTEEVGEKVTKEVSENVEEKVVDEMSEDVGEKVTKEVTEEVEEKVAKEVTENVQAALSEDIDSIIEQLEKVNERIERRPSREEIEAEAIEDERERSNDESTGSQEESP